MLNKEIFCNTGLKLDSITLGEISQVQGQWPWKVGLLESAHENRRRSLSAEPWEEGEMNKMRENIFD